MSAVSLAAGLGFMPNSSVIVAFRRRSVLEAVYTISTRDEVIIKILEGLDLTLTLGKHRYCNILNRGWSDLGATSCAFEYDYPTNGDPSARADILCCLCALHKSIRKARIGYCEAPVSVSGSVKVEPSGHPTSSIKSEEPAYEPAQALRDEIARLNGSGPQVIVRVKEEQISEYEHGTAGLIPPQSREYGLEKTAVGLSGGFSTSVAL
ncbi:hypothetical protein BJY52DRAFT_1219522 [Lactarius psammicola]|nr:hypothetical protein BJY52DRAFT_1219522 [Lactarius psammicola]